MNTFIDPLSREKRLQIAKEQGDGYRFMALKANATLGFPLLDIDQKTLKYLETCETLITTGGGLQRAKSPGAELLCVTSFEEE
jgi:hypothetical protein